MHHCSSKYNINREFTGIHAVEEGGSVSGRKITATPQKNTFTNALLL
jgi:hypothetical protein